MNFNVTRIDRDGHHVDMTFSGQDTYKVEDNGSLTVMACDPAEVNVPTVLRWSSSAWVSVAEFPTEAGSKSGPSLS